MRLELWQTIRGRAVQPVVSPLLSLSADFDDDPLDSSADESPPAWGMDFGSIAGFACVIDYRDSKGRTTQRLITCQRKDQSGAEIYVWAWCHSREARRQFRLSRIEAIFDARTGEDLGAPADLFGAFEIDRTQRSKPGWGLHVRLRADLVALLNAMVFLARCDRQFHALERSTLEDVICRFWLRCEAPDQPDCDAVLQHADRLAPDAETFYVALERCAQNPLLSRLLVDGARAMIDADGRIVPEETYWGSQIDQYLAGLR